MFEQGYPGRCRRWFAGVDAEAWPDRSTEPKDLDFLVYDKVLWDRDRQGEALVRPMLDGLGRRGLRYEVVRYGGYDHEVYRSLLGRARALLFLCDHETQGIAYQEAMASGLPVLAWDPGFWADPQWKDCYVTPPPASSVPFFSPSCGERFAELAAFEPALDRFLSRLQVYRPRDYVLDNLSPRRSGELYAEAYFALHPSRGRDGARLRSAAPDRPSRARAAYA
jgi:glycosyltransferase involved in cell wall biosynthesis